MPSREATDELVALSSILGPDLWVDSESAGRIVIAVTPEVIDDKEVVGAIAMEVSLPSSYPSSAAPIITCSSLAQHADLFEHRSAPKGGFFAPSAEQAKALAASVAAAVDGGHGDVVVFDAVAAAREWLATNAASKASDADDICARLADAEVSEDDLELDESDMDEELIEALLEVLPGDKRLQAAARLPSGSARQREAIKAVWLSLTPQQRRQMVADSDSDGDFEDLDEESEESEEEHAPVKRSSGGGGGKRKAPSLMPPPPAQRACHRGHRLTPVNSQPRDYRHLAAGVGNCDLCGIDFEYTRGGYHCDACRDWDCCVACGSQGASQGKAAKAKKKGRR